VAPSSNVSIMAPERAEQIDHDYVFFYPSGDPIRVLNATYERWRHTLRTSVKLRYRKPYCARHSYVSWNLMIGKNPLWVSKQHGHSVTTMLRVYTAWAEGAIEADIKAIKRAMKCRPARLLDALQSQDEGTAVEGHSATDTTVVRGPPTGEVARSRTPQVVYRNTTRLVVSLCVPRAPENAAEQVALTVIRTVISGAAVFWTLRSCLAVAPSGAAACEHSPPAFWPVRPTSERPGISCWTQE
jgi:hypothetical protein